MEYKISPEIWADKTKRGRALKRIHADANRKQRSPLIIELGKMLKEKREAKKLTLEQLEAATGIGFSYLIRIEKGRSNPGIELLEKLALAMGLELRIDFVRPKQPSHDVSDNS